MTLPAAVLGASAALAVACLALPVAVPSTGRRLQLSRRRPVEGAPAALAAWGAWIRRHARLSSTPLSDRGLAVVASIALALVPLAPAATGLVAVGVLAQSRVAAQRARRRAERRVAETLPDSVDLFLLCAGAGLSLPLALPLVARRAPAPLGEALAAAHAEALAGRPRADALVRALGPFGDRALGLAHVLVDHLRYGTPLVPGLERIGLELRLDRRRRCEEAARRVPVRLLLPLVVCVLPAFALLTVIPLLAASLRALPT